MMRPQISSLAIPSYDLGAVSMRVMTKMPQENTDDIDKEIELSYLFTPAVDFVIDIDARLRL